MLRDDASASVPLAVQLAQIAARAPRIMTQRQHEMADDEARRGGTGRRACCRGTRSGAACGSTAEPACGGSCCRGACCRSHRAAPPPFQRQPSTAEEEKAAEKIEAVVRGKEARQRVEQKRELTKKLSSRGVMSAKKTAEHFDEELARQQSLESVGSKKEWDDGKGAPAAADAKRRPSLGSANGRAARARRPRRGAASRSRRARSVPPPSPPSRSRRAPRAAAEQPPYRPVAAARAGGAPPPPKMPKAGVGLPQRRRHPGGGGAARRAVRPVPRGAHAVPRRVQGGADRVDRAGGARAASRRRRSLRRRLGASLQTPSAARRWRRRRRRRAR